MKIFKTVGQYTILISAFSFSLYLLIKNGNYSIAILAIITACLLILFSFISIILCLTKNKLAKELSKRTKSWWWMITLVFLTFSMGKFASYLFLCVISYLALKEIYSLKDKILDQERKKKDRILLYISYLSIPIYAYFAYIRWYAAYIIIIPVLIFLLIPIIFVLQGRAKGSIEALGFFTLSIMFFVFSFGHSLFLINLNVLLLLYCFFLTEIRDLVAYWMGKILSRFVINIPKNSFKKILSARVSENINPRKTWVTGIATSIIIGYISLSFIPIMPNFPNGNLTTNHAFMIGITIGFLGFMGDLVFSMIKRDIGIKDWGGVLPGHGGVIDRINALVFTIPIVFHFFNWIYF
jgi:phosphatidate cytidylyltransferase